MEIRPYLEDLEARIDVGVEEELMGEWRSFCRGEWKGDYFSPRRRRGAGAGVEWPRFGTNQTLKDPEKMIVQQLSGCSAALAKGEGALLAVRCNYGVPTLAIPFGPELFVMPDEMDTLPNCHPLGTERTHQVIEAGMPSVDHPYLHQVWETGRRFMEVKRQYPKLGKYLHVYHPDFQGPMDLLELIWGSEIFTAFMDEPEFVHKALRLITDYYIAAMRKWQEIVPVEEKGVSCHWGMLQPGQIMVRDDSAMNLPPEYFEEFILPYDQELLGAFGGGALHACGRVDHYAGYFSRMKDMKAFNMSQPHLNDMEKVLQETVDKGILIVGLADTAVRELSGRGRKLHGRVQTNMG